MCSVLSDERKTYEQSKPILLQIASSAFDNACVLLEILDINFGPNMPMPNA